MGYKKHIPGKKKKDEKPKRSFRGRTSDRSAEDKLAYKKRFDKDAAERRPYRKPSTNDRDRDDSQSERSWGSKPSFDRRRSGGDRPPAAGSRGKNLAGERPSRPAFKRNDRSEERDTKWNRKSGSEFFGDRRKGTGRKDYKKKSFNESVNEDKGLVRLNKYIANAGICSRREADELIEAGVVSVNGEVMTQMGYKVKPGDVVRYNDQTLKSERLVYILLNKPKDFITTVDDPDNRKTVMSLVANACKERVYPVGRLDRNTTGLLLLTNDGDLTRKLTHPSFEVQKIYQVELDKNLKPADLDSIEKGFYLADGFIKVDSISYVSGQDKSVVGVELHSGKNRIVRRIFEHLGYEVKKLDRVYFAGLSKKDLPRGRWRFLTEMEIASLKMMKGSKKFKNFTPSDTQQQLELE